MNSSAPINKEAEELAREASLRYVSDSQPGFTRLKNKNSFSYYDLAGRKITSPTILDRIKNLKVPPAWEDVWVCASPSGHLQATGRDEKGRKQYIYHSNWNEISNLTKFDKMLPFSGVLPDIRFKVTKDMNIYGLKQEKILALVVWLLDNTYVRIGNQEYARENGHYGLTTLRNKHVDIHSSYVTLIFTGKSGKKHQISITHPKVIKTIKKLEELPGYELFQYIDDSGKRHALDSQDVNDYLKSIAKEFVTAKDFRTWGGTVLTALTLEQLGDYETKKHLKTNIRSAINYAAKNLGNTPKVCRSYYIHPTVVTTYEEKVLIPHFEVHTSSKVRGLDRTEYATVTLLEKYS